MAENIKLLVYLAKDLNAGKAFFNTFLGVKPYVEGVYYVGYKVNELEIGLDPNGQAIIAYMDVQDIKESLKPYWTLAQALTRTSKTLVAAC